MTTLAVQSWSLYVFATFLIISRITLRRTTLKSWRQLQADDWLMVFVVVPYTASIVLANQSLGAQSVKGCKLRYVLEELHFITIWLVKTCFLVLYWRIFPVKSNLWKRRALQALSVLCCLSFIMVQSSWFAWCGPMTAHWDTMANHAQCAPYHGHTVMTLVLIAFNTVLIMLLPIPFISTPRRPLLAILLLLGTLVLAAGIISRVYILATPTSAIYLNWYTSETSLSIILANLPFLTSLVVVAAPARIRNISQSLKSSSQTALGQWPRNRRESWMSHSIPPLRVDEFGSVRTTLSELPSPIENGKMQDWNPLDVRHCGNSSDRGKRDERIGLSPSTMQTQWSVTTKTRVCGGLMNLSDVKTDSIDGWPMYSK